jgi:hypothetical protein
MATAPNLNSRNDLSPRGRLLFGLAFMAMGGFICLIGLGVLNPDPKGVHAPLWVVTCAGLAFLLAGLTVALGAASPATDSDGALPPSAPLALRMTQYLVGLAIVASLALVGSWVAFGPGERYFTTSVSLPFWSDTRAANEWSGRIAFGIGAVLTWLFFVLVAVQGWKKLFRRDGKPEAER